MTSMKILSNERQIDHLGLTSPPDAIQSYGKGTGIYDIFIGTDCYTLYCGNNNCFLETNMFNRKSAIQHNPFFQNVLNFPPKFNGNVEIRKCYPYDDVPFEGIGKIKYVDS
jgi:hypothetical protein